MSLRGLRNGCLLGLLPVHRVCLCFAAGLSPAGANSHLLQPPWLFRRSPRFVPLFPQVQGIPYVVSSSRRSISGTVARTSLTTEWGTRTFSSIWPPASITDSRRPAIAEHVREGHAVEDDDRSGWTVRCDRFEIVLGLPVSVPDIHDGFLALLPFNLC